jgi:hypothetical protein
VTILAHEAVEAGDVIQIVPTHKWGRCLAIVSDPKPFGCLCCVNIPYHWTSTGSAYIGLDFSEYRVLGVKAPFLDGV